MPMWGPSRHQREPWAAERARPDRAQHYHLFRRSVLGRRSPPARFVQAMPESRLRNLPKSTRMKKNSRFQPEPESLPISDSRRARLSLLICDERHKEVIIEGLKLRKLRGKTPARGEDFHATISSRNPGIRGFMYGCYPIRISRWNSFRRQHPDD